MTLNEAIEHAKEVADSYKDTDPDCQCAKDHRRLANWLIELKMARESVFSEIPQMAKTIHETHVLKTESKRLQIICDSLKAENAKLRECLQDFADLIENDDGFGVDQGWMLERIRELGIEVHP